MHLCVLSIMVKSPVYRFFSKINARFCCTTAIRTTLREKWPNLDSQGSSILGSLHRRPSPMRPLGHGPQENPSAPEDETTSGSAGVGVHSTPGGRRFHFFKHVNFSANSTLEVALPTACPATKFG